MAITNPAGPDSRQLWQTALGQLQLQMTKATFNAWLRDTELVAVEAGPTYIIRAGTEPAREWLEHRLAPTIRRTLSQLVGADIGLRFLVAPAPDPNPAPPPPVSPPDSPPSRPQDSNPALTPTAGEDQLAGLDFAQLWQKTGFTQISDYAIHYWRIYLGRAFDLWECLVSQDKRNVKLMAQGHLSYWTDPRSYTYRSLARLLACSRPTLTGRLVRCSIYEKRKQAAHERGETNPQPGCCGNHHPCRIRRNSKNQPECVYWLEGILERLNREGLVGVERIARPGKPRAHELRLQVWRLLPPLTPAQVAGFTHDLDRDRHRAWLERYGHLIQLDLAAWEQIRLPSLVPHLPGYDWGRRLLEPYCNNPFLNPNNANYDPKIPLFGIK